MTKYDSKFCTLLKVHCENGKSLESFCATQGLSPRLITDWYHEHPEFQEAVECGPCQELYYWEGVLIAALHHKDRDVMTIAKSKIDYLLKYITSPVKKNTFNDLKDVTSKKQNASSGDLVKDLYLLSSKKKEKLNDR